MLCQASPKNQRQSIQEVRQQIEAVYTTFDDAHRKHDAAATAALYTQDAVQVRSWESDGGLASGQQAIEKRFAVEFASSPGEFVGKLVQVNPVGDEISTISEWSWVIWKGYYVRIFVRDADTWKICMECATLSMIPR